MRSATTQTMLSKIERIADIEQTVIPAGKTKSICRVNFRAHIDGRWYSALGEELFDNKSSIDLSDPNAKDKIPPKYKVPSYVTKASKK
jgi:hypothetical protein